MFTSIVAPVGGMKYDTLNENRAHLSSNKYIAHLKYKMELNPANYIAHLKEI